jgi:hypothetical protein
LRHLADLATGAKAEFCRQEADLMKCHFLTSDTNLQNYN